MQEETHFESETAPESGAFDAGDATASPAADAVDTDSAADLSPEAVSSADEDEAVIPYDGDLEPDDEPTSAADRAKGGKTSAALGTRSALPPLEEVAPDELAKTGAALVARNTRNSEVSAYFNALRAGLAGKKQPQAAAALQRFMQTGAAGDLKHLRACFPAAVQQRITGETLNRLKNEGRAFRALQREQKRMYLAKKQERFAGENNRWLRAPERRQAVEMALSLGQANTDLNALKTLVDGIEKAAVGRYLKKQAAQENRFLQEKIGSAGVSSSVGTARPSPWLTRAEFNRLSPQEYDKRYDRIVQQIELEKQGKLPRRLT